MTSLRLLTVGISDCIVSRDPAASIATHALGSCIALTIHDPLAKVSGLLHFMLPDSTIDREKAKTRPFMYADTGIPMLFLSSYDLGALKQRLIVTAIGGAQVIDPNDTFNVGKRNYLALRKILWKSGVIIHHEEIGGTQPRNVRMDVPSGRIIVSHGREQREIPPPQKERLGAAHVS